MAEPQFSIFEHSSFKSPKRIRCPIHRSLDSQFPRLVNSTSVDLIFNAFKDSAKGVEFAHQLKKFARRIFRYL